ncbi:efflux RND transporter periplasmic adaptor subunit [Aeromonas veronii]|uniref:efflux RND transporter periplasmic adaptor subunit n=1 Tax=Aeromonas veronii TaxID=654 RepID=UPI00187F5F5F|nr:efflux RND transporter periplasmic adaptor subunit [Aeromonas veronii]MBE8734421.1 efflux RND transporter periplasmic adaptor subunit [Aeromonas veronii]MBE8737856.1 efflux RND transporter periplasmic adaptor subunit [Aeromonas veronii]MBE8743021.1 efflux RND transporter periplasmic adaptor subunit [Aeromonas veronii]MBE8762325.1 efflux RND transporter periplasmic adaptor subunit [Aeromonas veronii]MBE8838567.1 efflux RND transporter periplasmic adaptor subunit [Aeromonas veronii]
MMFVKQRYAGALLAVIAAFGLAGCDVAPQEQEAPAPPQVSVLTLTGRELVISEDLPARVAALRSADIRAQISGIVQRRLFEQGAEISAGTVLFQINPAPFKADVDSAAAALQRAEAVLARARIQIDRLKPLLRTDAISRQTYDDAISQRDQAAADVAQARATLARHQLNLQFASLEAPIDGRIDQALVSEGALVSPTDATPMARIQQIDQVYVDVRQPASVLESLRQQAGSTAPELAVEILGSNGTPLGMQGRILFSGIEVDAGTGDVLLRVLVDNPERRLLPGLYVQARIPRARYANALTVPQQAVVRTSGQTSVWVVDGQGQAQLVPVNTAELVNNQYRIASGLSAGQQVVIEGIDRLTPGGQVTASPWQPPAVSQPADGGIR